MHTYIFIWFVFLLSCYCVSNILYFESCLHFNKYLNKCLISCYNIKSRCQFWISWHMDCQWRLSVGCRRETLRCTLRHLPARKTSLSFWFNMELKSTSSLRYSLYRPTVSQIANTFLAGENRRSYFWIYSLLFYPVSRAAVPSCATPRACIMRTFFQTSIHPWPWCSLLLVLTARWMMVCHFF